MDMKSRSLKESAWVVEAEEGEGEGEDDSASGMDSEGVAGAALLGAALSSKVLVGVSVGCCWGLEPLPKDHNDKFRDAPVRFAKTLPLPAASMGDAT